MKKVMILTLVLGCLYSGISKAGCPIDYIKEGVLPPPCPSITCPKGEFMGDDGKCYSCDVDKSISYFCIGFKKLEKACPDRLIEMCGGTVLKCPENQEPVNKICTPKCDKGFTRNEHGACCTNDYCILDEY